MFEDYKNQINTDITTKTADNSIEPVTVGNGFTDLVDLLEDPIESINNQGYSSGTSIPSDLIGADLDLYYRLQDPVVIYRKESGSWVEKVSIPLATLTFPDGNFTVKTTLNAGVLTAFPGFWFISNNKYNTTTQTQFNISTADDTLETQDLIYADTNDDILFLAGTPGLGQPALPANCVLIDIVIIPSVANGSDPYLTFGNVIGSTEVEKVSTSYTQADLVLDGGLYYLPVSLTSTVIEIKYKDDASTKTNFLGLNAIEQDTAWATKRIYFTDNNAKTITITTI